MHKLSHLVNRFDDPVDAGIFADSLVLGVDEDNLEIFVGGILVDPVGVEDSQIGATTTGHVLQRWIGEIAGT